MEGEQRETRRTRSTVSHSPASQTQHLFQSDREEMKQDAPMSSGASRIYALASQTFDLRYWPSSIIPENPPDTRVRNYILSDLPPHKIEIPGDLKVVQQYFDTEYKATIPNQKLLHVHIGTGETMMSDVIPATRRLWGKWIREWLGTVHHTLVRMTMTPEGTVSEVTEPHPDDNFFPPPGRPSRAFGTDFGKDPNRARFPTDDIVGDYFKTLRKEKEEFLQDHRDRHQKHNEESAAGKLGSVGHANQGNKKTKSKRQRQKKARAEKQAAESSKNSDKMKEVKFLSNEAEFVSEVQLSISRESGGSYATGPYRDHDSLHPNDPLPVPQPALQPATGLKALPIRQRSTNSAFSLVTDRLLDITTKLAGDEQDPPTHHGYEAQVTAGGKPKEYDELETAED